MSYSVNEFVDTVLISNHRQILGNSMDYNIFIKWGGWNSYISGEHKKLHEYIGRWILSSGKDPCILEKNISENILQYQKLYGLLSDQGLKMLL